MIDLSLNTIITIGGIIFAALGAWFTVKGSVKGLTDKVTSLTMQVTSLWGRKDESIDDVTGLKHDVKHLQRDVSEIKDEQKYQRRKSDV